MNDRFYPYLKYAAILAAIAWVSWSLYDFLRAKEPGDFAYHDGTNYFADGYYDKALIEFDNALADAPEHLAAKRGRAETLIVLNREREAINAYDELLAYEPDNPGHWANLGIAYDRLGKHQQALTHYQQALKLDAEIGAGPNWLTRFLRNQAEKPPGIAERAAYLKHQLTLPEDQRQLSDPELDQSQRPYKK